MIGALIGAGASILGGLLGSSSSKKAANTAAAAQLQATQQNNALIREMYGRNEANFQPYFESGRRANALIDSFLYGGPQEEQITYSPGIEAPAPRGPEYGNGSGIPQAGGGFYDLDRMGPDHSGGYDAQFTGPVPTVAPGTPAPGGRGMSGYQAFVASPYYQNPLMEGYRGLNHGLASGGNLFSGDAARRAIRFGQDYGAGRQDEFIGLAQGQASRGFGAASALAGVGQNMVSDTTANTRIAADAASNAALLRGQANNQLWTGIANPLGYFASSYFK